MLGAVIHRPGKLDVSYVVQAMVRDLIDAFAIADLGVTFTGRHDD
jgi:hypothetical protein